MIDGKRLRMPRFAVAVAVLVTLAAPRPGLSLPGPGVGLRSFVTAWYSHGLPYAEARAYGSAAVPELLAMLADPAMEEHWSKVVWMLGCIGDPSATGPLLDFMKRQHGEISVSAFRGVLAVLPSLGHLARAGDPTAAQALVTFTRSGDWEQRGIVFRYGRYRGEALSEVLGRTAIQGLGVAGTTEASSVLEAMSRSMALRPSWRDNVTEALQFNLRIRREGVERVYGTEVQR